MPRQVAKVFFSEEDIQDMQEQGSHGNPELWNTWQWTLENGETIDIQLYLGDEDEI